MSWIIFNPTVERITRILCVVVGKTKPLQRFKSVEQSAFLIIIHCFEVFEMPHIGQNNVNAAQTHAKQT